MTPEEFIHEWGPLNWEGSELLSARMADDLHKLLRQERAKGLRAAQRRALRDAVEYEHEARAKGEKGAHAGYPRYIARWCRDRARQVEKGER